MSADNELDTYIRALGELGALDIYFRVTRDGDVRAVAYYQQSDVMQGWVEVIAPTADECVAGLARKLVECKVMTAARPSRRLTSTPSAATPPTKAACRHE